jgi:hypothetical protein
MRTRSILLVVAILLVAGFAALNWAEIVRPTTLLFGPVAMDAPLGAILLGLLALTLVLFLASTAAMRTQSLIDYRNHQKTLEAQRELADKAEASRFNELRTHMDEHMRRMGERDSIAASEYDKAMLESRREVQTQMEQMNRMLAARMTELEHRLESRFERAGLTRPAGVVPPVGAPVVRNEPLVQPSSPVREHAMAQEAERARAQAVRDEERLRDERIRHENELRREEKPADRPSDSGWRKWF